MGQTDALMPYNLLLVAAPLRPELLARLSRRALAEAVPLIYMHSVGFYAHFSVQLPPTFPIVDTHPSPEATADLRLLSPWPELARFAAEKTAGLDAMSDDDHGHVPYIALLLHHLSTWKAAHDDCAPRNYKEKTAFRTQVAQSARRTGAHGSDENFEEAEAAVLKSLNPSEPSSAVKDVFAADECTQLKAESASFWVVAHAIGQFYDRHGVLPLPGAVPDMKARSADYIQLQNLYKAKARSDVAEVLHAVRALESQLGRLTAVDEKEVEAFCKNAAHIKLVRGRPLHMVQPGVKMQWGRPCKGTRYVSSGEDGEDAADGASANAHVPRQLAPAVHCLSCVG